MIYTVTFNPAIDYIVYMKELEKGSINRCERETAFFGGKGINVSFMLKGGDRHKRPGPRHRARGHLSAF